MTVEDPSKTGEEGGGDVSSLSDPPPSVPKEVPVPPVPEAPKVDTDVAQIMKEQNELLKKQNELLADSVNKTSAIYDAVFDTDDGSDGNNTIEPDKVTKTVVEPDPPPQPHTPVDEAPTKPVKKGWRKFY
jgi:hypothetical protein